MSLLASILRYRFQTFQANPAAESIWLDEVAPPFVRLKDESFMEWAVRVGLAPERKPTDPIDETWQNAYQNRRFSGLPADRPGEPQP